MRASGSWSSILSLCVTIRQCLGAPSSPSPIPSPSHSITSLWFHHCHLLRPQALAELIISPSQALRTSAPFGMLLRQVLLVGNHLNQGTAK